MQREEHFKFDLFVVELLHEIDLRVNVSDQSHKTEEKNPNKFDFTYVFAVWR